VNDAPHGESSPLADIATVPLVDHELVVFYEADKPPASFLKLGMLAAQDAAWLPKDQIPALAGRHREEPVWVRYRNPPAGGDFHEHIRKLLAGDRHDLLEFWTLGEHAARLLKTADLYEQPAASEDLSAIRKSRVRKRLQLNLSAAATKRLADHGIAAAPLDVAIGSATLASFKTSYGFACVSLQFRRADGKALTALEFLEAQVAIGRFNEVAWVSAETGAPLSSDRFTLGQLIRALALGRWAETSRSGRASTYAFLSFDTPVDVVDRDRLGVHVARNYTTDYVISSQQPLVAPVADFETVRHAVALEGAATIIGPTRDHPELPSFLKAFKENTFRRHYVPIALLTLHEHAFLVDKTSASVIPQRLADQAEETIEVLSNLIEASLLFRLCFRFSEVSYITMHNSVSRAFRRALRLDEMLRDFATDLIDVENHLRRVSAARRQRAEAARHRKYYWTSVLGVSALAFLTASTLAKEIIKLASVDDKTSTLVGFFFGLFFFVAAIVFSYLKKPETEEPEDESGHFTFEAMLDNMFKGAGGHSETAHQHESETPPDIPGSRRLD
jgi:hypothetical protein